MKIALAPVSLALCLAACGSTNSTDMSSTVSAATPVMTDVAQYEVTLTPMWNASTHPLDYPKAGLLTGPHFSGLIGASHAASYGVFTLGSAPTPGLERLSEEGKHSPLDGEIRAAIAAGKAGTLFETDAVKDLTKSMSTTFRVSREFPMVSAVAMIAPSPDWFAGAANVELMQGGQWIAEKEVVLQAFDSGGDTGTTYTASDADAQPKQPTRLNDAAPFVRDGQHVPVGKLTFRRI